jgi:hypothetical protein
MATWLTCATESYVCAECESVFDATLDERRQAVDFHGSLRSFSREPTWSSVEVIDEKRVALIGWSEQPLCVSVSTVMGCRRL